MITSALISAWKKLVFAYLGSFLLFFVLGILLLRSGIISGDALYSISGKRIAIIIPLFIAGLDAGIDAGILIFFWNCAAALATISIFYGFVLFDPSKIRRFPRILRSALIGKIRMKLLCFLPGCRHINEEHIRRLYVWMMIPLLGMILLGCESGLSAATGSELFGSYWLSLLSFIPHGIIEIPAMALAGSIAYSAHLLLKKQSRKIECSTNVFDLLEEHKSTVQPMKMIVAIVFFLFVAGLIEAHVSMSLVETIN